MTVNRGLPVNLPRAATSQQELRDSFNITITRNGEIFLNKESITLQELGQRVQAGVQMNSEILTIINADDQVFHGTIVDVMDEVRQAGVSRLAIAVKPERRGQP
jgi:biopolymer transport protein ExbD